MFDWVLHTTLLSYQVLKGSKLFEAEEKMYTTKYEKIKSWFGKLCKWNGIRAATLGNGCGQCFGMFLKFFDDFHCTGKKITTKSLTQPCLLKVFVSLLSQEHF